MLDWEEGIFNGLKALWKKYTVAPRERKLATVRVQLEDQRKSLFLLGHLIAGQPIQLHETPDRILCREDRIFLPSHFSLGDSREANLALYRIKTIAGALAIRERWTANDGPLADLLDNQPAASELPGLQQLLSTATFDTGQDEEADLWQVLGPLPDKATADQPTTTDSNDPLTHASALETAGEGTAVTELEGEGKSEVEVVESKEDFGTGTEMPEHVFEKVETLEEYDGQSRKSDAEDALKEHEEALRELDMRQLMRSAERPGAIYRADILLDGAGLDSHDDTPATGIPYPEWDDKKRRYRPDWCFVKPTRIDKGDTAWSARTAASHAKLIRQLRRQFASLTTEWLRTRRQNQGPEFDIDALVAAETDRLTGHTPTEAVYQDRRRDTQDVAALILLDQSYSTESWIDDKRVLDTIRETIFCAGEVLDEFIDSFAIAGFSSHTRRDCRFDLLKDFADPWTNARDRLGSIEPDGYTRIGPALRHATALLNRVPARRKLIILVSDGRPCDYDRYEGKHGIRDVHKAIEAAALDGIRSHAYAIEKRAAEHFPRMFGHHHYDIIPRAEVLAQHLCRLFLRIKQTG